MPLLVLNSKDRVSYNSTTPYNCQSTLPAPINADTFELLGVVFPNQFSPLRAPYNYFTFRDGNGTVYTCTVASSFKSVSDLCTEISTASSGKLTATYDSNNMKISLLGDTGTYTIGTEYLAKHLGITGMSVNSTTATAASNYANLSFDLVFYLQISDRPSDMVSPVPATFVIPILGGTGEISNTMSEITMRQQVDLEINTSRISVVWRDVYGNVLPSGQDYVIIFSFQ